MADIIEIKKVEHKTFTLLRDDLTPGWYAQKEVDGIIKRSPTFPHEVALESAINDKTICLYDPSVVDIQSMTIKREHICDMKRAREFLDIIDNRYSYRGVFEPTPVAREHLKLIMEAGLAAPSGCNKQTTSLIGVDDPDLIRSLGSLLNKPGFASAPAAICVLTQQVIAYGNTCFNVQDYSAAIENILLAVSALGYASCWVEGYITGESGISAKMAEILGVSQEYQVVAYLPIGMPEQQFASVKKKPFEQRAWFNEFKPD